jgi:hypothetical protein
MTAVQVTDDNTIWCGDIALWINDYRIALRICNTYCLSTATIVSRMRLNVTFICALPVLLYSQNIQLVNPTRPDGSSPDFHIPCR